jgi:tight adherence protein B
MHWVRPARYALLPAISAAGAAFAGVGGLCGAAALAVVGNRYWRSRRAARRRLVYSTALAEGIRLLVGELRAGVHPTAAAAGTAVDAAPEVSGFFRDLASMSRLGGESTALPHESGRRPSELDTSVGRMLRAWTLAQRHGVALADLLDAVRRDVEHRLAFVRDLEAKMAGPRATAAVLTGLPFLGILLGEAVGADPLAVLTERPIGQVFLVVGLGLLCSGMFWTMRLTEVVVRS